MIVLYGRIPRSFPRMREPSFCGKAWVPAFAGTNGVWTSDSRSIDRSKISRPRLQHIGRPVPHVVRADGDIVHLAMVEAAFLAVEYLQRLVLRADRREAFLGNRQRDLLVA